MLTRTKPMSRSTVGLQRSRFASAAGGLPTGEPDRSERLAARAARAMAEVTPRASVHAPCSGPTSAVPKAVFVRSRLYRHLVAQLPCKYCGVPGLSQCAHANTGKGASLKVCDLESFPLCIDRPGVRGCHALFDQGALFTKLARREIERAWVADTQRQIWALGLWPKSLRTPVFVDLPS